MRVLLDRLKGFAELLLLAVMLVSWGSSDAVAQFFDSPGGGSGGFTGRPLITVELSADKTSVPANLAGFGPNPSLPYTSTLTAVVKQDGRLFPTNIQFDLAPNLAQGALFDPADLTKGFRSLPLASTSGLATAFFQASSTPGKVTITASAQDPNTGQTVSSSIQITVVAEARPATSMTFTGPYVNAVLAGQSRFALPDGTPVQNGAYSRVVSVVVNDANGNPTNPNTKINFFLIDGPIAGYPTNPGSFVIAGADGDPQEGGLNFSALGGQFLTKGVRPLDRLVLSGLQLFRTVQTVTSETSLTIQSTRPFGLENRTAIPYVIGHTENGAILSPSFTDLNGVASTTLTYPVTRVGQTAILMACTDDYLFCGVLNTCDVNGANCKSVYLGATNGSDWVLTTSATELGPNTTTPVKLCLKDPNFTPLAATAIRYDMSTVGVAKVKVNGVEGKQGQVLTGGDGCATVTIQSSGQPPGSKDIVLSFIADNIPADSAVKITIKGPGEGKIDGVSTCQVTSAGSNKGDPPTPPTATCSVQMQLVDDNFSPLAGVLVTVGDGVAPAGGVFSVAFSPAEGKLGKTDDKGALAATVNFTGAGAFSIPFKVLNGTATYTLKFNVPAPTDKADDDGATTTNPLGAISPTTLPDATAGSAYTVALSVTGGSTPYTWSLVGAPAGLAIDPVTGIISGTPTVANTFQFIAKVTDKSSPIQSATANLTLTVKVGSGGGGGGGGSTANPEALGLATTQTSVKSNNSDVATITATVLDGSNVGINGKAVTFSATGGQLSASTVVTDNAGSASVEFRSGTVNSANQVVSVTAQVDRTATTANPATTLTRVIPIQIGGTSLAVSASKTSLPANGVVTNDADIAQVQVTVLDSGSLPIFDSPVCFVQTRKATDPPASSVGSVAFFNAQKAAITSPSCLISGVTGTGVQVGKTDVNGKLTVLVTGVADGNLTLNAGASGARVSQDFTVQAAGQVFKIIAPAITPPATTIPSQLITTGSFTVTVSDPRAGASKVRFTTSLGTWDGAPAGSPTIVDVPVVGGQASAVLRSTNAGLANVVVSDVDVTPPLSDNIQLQFTADICNATKLILDASPRVVPISTGGVQNISNLVATLLTGLDQPIANAVIGFSLQSSTGGGEIISPPTATTSSTGEAKTTFISGARASPAGGIIVQATVNKPAACAGGGGTLTSQFNMVITDKAGSVTIGASTKVEVINQDTAYSLPMSVLVADVNGNPVPNTQVSLSAWPTSYSTGIREGVFTETTPSAPFISDTFLNEDLNENTICDQPAPPNTATTSVCPTKGAGEDVNADGVLTPANTVAGNLPLKATTDQNGLATFNLVYLKQYADWVDDRIQASALVGGTQIVSQLSLGLTGSVSDETASPPVLPSSPFNAVCPFTVTVDKPAVTVTVGGASVPVVLTPVKNPLATIGLNRPVSALVDSRKLVVARVSPGIGADPLNLLNPAISAVRSGTGVPGGTAVVRYFFSCAFVDVQVTVTSP